MGITALVVGTAVGLGALGATMLSGGSKSTSAPKPPALPKAPSPEKATQTAQVNASKRRAQSTQTVYSSPLGAGGMSSNDQANVARKSLTGQ